MDLSQRNRTFFADRNNTVRHYYSGVQCSFPRPGRCFPLWLSTSQLSREPTRYPLSLPPHLSRDLASEGWCCVEGVGEEGEGYSQRCCVIFWKFIYLNKNGRRRERRGETVSVHRIHSHCHGFQCQASRAAMASVLIVAVIFCQAGAG